MSDILSVIGKLKFTEAKSMKNIPHEYTVKREWLKTEYETLYKYISENHYIKYFWNKPYKYCDIGEYTYWIMSDDISTSKIINRVKKGE